MKPRIFSVIAFFSTLVLTACKTVQRTDGIISPQKGSHVLAPAKQLVTYLTGDSLDITTKAVPGLLLAGGSTDLDSAVKWFLDLSNGGDIVVLRATESDGYYKYMFHLSKVNSVETLVIDTFSKAWLPEVARKIRNAEALFISGGDQYNYVRFWKHSPVEDAINYLLNTKKVPVGGTSAGLAILGAAYFSAKNGTVTSAQALAQGYRVNESAWHRH
jgi:cyanophycinase